MADKLKLGKNTKIQEDYNKLIEKIKKDSEKNQIFPGYMVELDAIKKNPKRYFKNTTSHKLTKSDKIFLDLINKCAMKPFFEGENKVSIDKSLEIGPFYLANEFTKKNKKSLSDGIYIYTLTNNKYKKIKCIPFSIYEETTKTFYFLNRQNYYVQDVCNTDFKDFKPDLAPEFCHYHIIKDVDKKTAYDLALFYRAFIYLEINYHKNKKYQKTLGLKTTNFMSINIYDYPGNPTIFMIADYGIPDKNLNHKDMSMIKNGLLSYLQVLGKI